jgi:hypothetical protein
MKEKIHHFNKVFLNIILVPIYIIFVGLSFILFRIGDLFKIKMSGTNWEKPKKYTKKDFLSPY